MDDALQPRLDQSFRFHHGRDCAILRTFLRVLHSANELTVRIGIGLGLAFEFGASLEDSDAFVLIFIIKIAAARRNSGIRIDIGRMMRIQGSTTTDVCRRGGIGLSMEA